jgi:hypothetical protein
MLRPDRPKNGDAIRSAADSTTPREPQQARLFFCVVQDLLFV